MIIFFLFVIVNALQPKMKCSTVLPALRTQRILFRGSSTGRSTRSSTSMKLAATTESVSLLNNFHLSSIWSAPVGVLKGVGPKMIDTLKQLDINTIADVLFHFPTNIIDRRERVKIKDAKVGDVITCEVKVVSINKSFRGRPHSVMCTDSDGTSLTVNYYFVPAQIYMKWAEIERDFHLDSFMLLSGKLTNGKTFETFEMVHPDVTISADSSPEYIQDRLGVEPVYGLTKGLTGSKIRSIVKLALAKVIEDNSDGFSKLKKNDPLNHLIQDWMSATHRNEKKWPTFMEAIHQVHHPDNLKDIEINSTARTRLAFDDFVSQFMHRFDKEEKQKIEREEKLVQLQNLRIAEYGEFGSAIVGSVRNHSIVSNGFYSKTFEKILPFDFTNCQRNAVRDITLEISEDKKMSRLLQGDVGSGKTLVAISAMLSVIETDKQGAILAPTELLAKQHFNVICKYMEAISDSLGLVNQEAIGSDGIAPLDSINNVDINSVNVNNNVNSNSNNIPRRRLRVELITRHVKGKERDRLIADMQNGLIDLLIGTHAILSDEIINSIPFLGLVVIDEEQRFGVKQRELLSSIANTIYMTATPIPRSLFILLQNGNTMSTLIEKPPMKRNVKTVILPYKSVNSIISRLKYHVPFGTKIFWVSPTLMANEEEPTGFSVMERYEELSLLFPGKVGLLHGKMTSEDKDAVMNSFSKTGSEMSILVATTVIEVGVDVPDSSICIIDRASNFGLSQLHQIRGRIGRGEKPATEQLDECFCVLLYDDAPPSDIITEGEKMRIISEDLESLPLPENTPLPPPMKLTILAESSDGFVIAEQDLLLRGPGDFFGLEQSGLTQSGLRAGSIMPHLHLLKHAHDTASLIYRDEYHIPSQDAKIRSLLDIFQTSTSTSTSPTLETGAKKEKGKSKSITDSKSSKSVFYDLTVSEGILEPVLVLLDLETSDLLRPSGRIIQLGAKVMNNSNNGNSNNSKNDRNNRNYGVQLSDDLGVDLSVDDTFDCYIKPKNLKLSPIITQITGITQHDLDTKGRCFKIVWSEFVTWLDKISQTDSGNRPIVLIAHNGAKFDIPYLDGEIKRNKFSKVHGDWMATSNIVGIVDTLTLLRREDIWLRRKNILELSSAKYQPEKNSLGTIYEYIFKEKIKNAHSAMGDVLALEAILESEGFRDIWRQYANDIQVYL